MKLTTINNIVVKPMKTPNDDDKRPPRGYKLISEPYANIFLCSKKKTGKSSVVAKMALEFAGKGHTSVHIFCSTVHIDPTYIALVDRLESKGITCYTSTSIKDDDNNDLVDDILKIDEEIEFEDHLDKEDDDVEEPNSKILDLDPKPETKKRKKKKSKYKEIRRLFIFDDLANEVRKSMSLKKLLKQNRHALYKTIVASQYINDLDPQSINQLDYVLLFKCHNDAKLLELHRKMDLSIEPDEFIKMYDTVTGDRSKYDFLYISRFEEYRKNFNQKIIL